MYVFPDIMPATTTNALPAAESSASTSDPKLSWLLQSTRGEVKDAAAAQSVLCRPW